MPRHRAGFHGAGEWMERASSVAGEETAEGSADVDGEGERAGGEMAAEGSAEPCGEETQPGTEFHVVQGRPVGPDLSPQRVHAQGGG